MALHQPHFLSADQLSEILGSFEPGAVVSVVRIRRKNRQEIRRSEQVQVEELRAELLEAAESGWGGDLEVDIHAIGKTLVGHHDGVYWLVPMAGEGASNA